MSGLGKDMHATVTFGGEILFDSDDVYWDWDDDEPDQIIITLHVRNPF